MILSALGLLTNIGGAASMALSFYEPGKRTLQYTTNRFQPNVLLAPDQLVSLLLMDRITDQQYYERMRAYGYSTTAALEYKLAARNRLSPMDFVTLYRRGILNIQQLTDRLKELNFDTGQLSWLLQASEYYPSAPDLVRFAVREVYTPSVVDQYGMMEDLPPKFIEESFKAGLGEEQARNYWASHWELPSIQMGFAMLHRRIINQDELNLLLKSLDVMPGWRDKLTQLSYAPLTRVDARRMYGFGVLSYDELVDTYKDIGYNNRDATRLADFTVQYEDTEYTGLTRSKVIDSYVDGLITVDELTQYLRGLGYGENIVQFWTDTAVYDKTVKDIKSRTNELKTLYLDGRLTLEQIKMQLLEEGVNDQYLAEVLTDFERSKIQTYKNPTVSTLERWYLKGVIDSLTYSKYMRRQGYDSEVIAYYLTELTDPDEPVRRKYLKQETYVDWYVQDIIDQYMLDDTLKGMGISKRDRDVIILQANNIKQGR